MLKINMIPFGANGMGVKGLILSRAVYLCALCSIYSALISIPLHYTSTYSYRLVLAEWLSYAKNCMLKRDVSYRDVETGETRAPTPLIW